MHCNHIQRVIGRSVWTAKDLEKSEDWIYQIPPEGLEEIDDTVKKHKHAEALSMTRIDMPLTSISSDILEIREEIKSGRGFVIIKGLPGDRYSDEELAKIFWGFGTHFGYAVPQSFLGDRIGDIIDLSDEEPDPVRRRGYHSGGLQETHTDATDIVGMISLRAAKSGGACRLASAHAIHNIMLDHCPGFLKQLYKGFYNRGTDSDAEAAGVPPFRPHRVPVYSRSHGWLNCSYVRGFVQRAIDAGDITVNPIELASMDAFSAISNHPDMLVEMLLKRGEMQFFNNRTVLHARASYEDYPEKEQRRHLCRLWLEVPEWPPLSDEQKYYNADIMKRWGSYQFVKLAGEGGPNRSGSA